MMNIITPQKVMLSSLKSFISNEDIAAKVVAVSVLMVSTKTQERLEKIQNKNNTNKLVVIKKIPAMKQKTRTLLVKFSTERLKSAYPIDANPRTRKNPEMI